MNYIHHMNAWFAKIYTDDRLHSAHFALYVTLFQFWNLNRFENPVTICREDVMKLSKIGSANTYTRCIKQLHEWGYLIYEPSHSPFVGSKVYLYNFDTTSDNTTNTTNNKTGEKLLRPYIKHNKQYKHIKQEDEKFKNYDEPL